MDKGMHCEVFGPHAWLHIIKDRSKKREPFKQMTILRKRKKEASYIMNGNATWLLPFCTDKNNKMCKMLLFFLKIYFQKEIQKLIIFGSSLETTIFYLPTLLHKFWWRSFRSLLSVFSLLLVINDLYDISLFLLLLFLISPLALSCSCVLC